MTNAALKKFSELIQATTLDQATLLTMVDMAYDEKLIKLSKMVESGKVSEGAARHHILPVIRKEYNQRRAIVNGM